MGDRTVAIQTDVPTVGLMTRFNVSATHAPSTATNYRVSNQVAVALAGQVQWAAPLVFGNGSTVTIGGVVNEAAGDRVTAPYMVVEWDD